MAVRFRMSRSQRVPRSYCTCFERSGNKYSRKAYKYGTDPVRQYSRAKVTREHSIGVTSFPFILIGVIHKTQNSLNASTSYLSDALKGVSIRVFRTSKFPSFQVLELIDS
jgi:lysozyme family protein